ncbi:hypothetical protein [Desulfonema limicola]|nr:hypothetical protein [Desulfonema limicola]
MSNFVMNPIFRSIFIIMFCIMSITVYNSDACCQVSIQCSDCTKGTAVFKKFANQMNLENAILWDAKTSEMIPGFWHFSFEDTLANQHFVVFTNSRYMIPNLIPVVPGRDLKGTENKPEFQKEISRQKSQQNRIIKPINQIQIEQEGMFLGKINPEKWAVKLIQGEKEKGYILLIDTLWDENLANFLDEFRNYDKKWRKYKGYTIWFAPFFGFMGHEHSAILGKHYHALVKTGIPPVQAAYGLSRVSQAVKANKFRLREYAYQLAGTDKKAAYDKNLLKIHSSSVFALNTETIKLGIMNPQYYIIDGKVHFWGNDE